MIISKVNNYIHKHGKITAVFILAVIAIPFVFMTGGGGRGSSAKTIDPDQVIATFGGNDMTLGKLMQAYPRLRPSDFSPKFQPMLKMLIEQQITLDTAKDLKLGEVSKEDLVADIAKSYPNFATDGKFDYDKYSKIPAENRSGLETFIEEKIIRERLTNKITMQGEASVTDDKVKAAFQKENSTLNIFARTFKEHQFAKDVKLTDEEVKAYFTKNIEDYRIKEQKIINIVTFNKNSFMKEVKVNDELVKAFYEENKEAKYNFGKVNASHILVKLAKGADKKTTAAAKAKIDKILAEVKAGKKTFAEIAKKSSEGPSGKSGGSLGWFAQGRMVPEFDKVIFVEKDGKITSDVKMKIGEVSTVVKTQFGFHIVKLDKLPTPFKTLKAKVTLDYKLPQAKILMEKAAYKFADTVYSQVMETTSPYTTAPKLFKDAAKVSKLTVTQSKAFSNGDSIPQITSQFFEKASTKLDFTNPVSEGIVGTGGKQAYVISIEKVIESTLPKFETATKAKADIKKILTDKKSKELMAAAADKYVAELKTALKTKIAFEQLVKNQKLKTIKPFKANENPQGLNAAVPVKRELTDQKVGAVVGPIKAGKGIDVVYVKNITKPTDKDFEAKKNTYSKQYKTEQGQKAWNDYKADLIEKQDIKFFAPFAEEVKEEVK